MVKRGMLRDFKAMVAAEGYWDENKFNKTESTYEYPNGTIVEFFSCDNAGKVHGPARDILFVNEAQGIPREIFRQLDIRTRKKVIIDYNPVRKFWGETEFVGDRYTTIHSTYKDNPYLTPEQVAAIEKNKNGANWWRVYGEGLTGGVEGNVYPEYEVIDDMPETYTGRCLGLDFGFVNDPTAIVDIRMEGWDLYVDLLCYVDNGGRVIHETKVKPQASAREGFRHIVYNFIFGVNVTLYTTRQALTIHAPPIGIVLVLLDGCHLFGGQVRVIRVR